LAESFLLSPSSDDSDHDSDTDTDNSTVDSVEVSLDLAGPEEKETITSADLKWHPNSPIADLELKNPGFGRIVAATLLKMELRGAARMARMEEFTAKSNESFAKMALRLNVTPSINTWNHFQQQHGGKGWSRDEMASKYHEQRSLDGFPH